MEFEIGKEYAYHGKKAKLVFIDEEIEGTKFLVVHKANTIGHIVSWAGEGELGELSPYHDFKRGEPVMVRDDMRDVELRRYFSHVDSKRRPLCFADGGTAWASELDCLSWEFCRKLTPEEQEEYDRVTNG